MRSGGWGSVRLALVIGVAACLAACSSPEEPAAGGGQGSAGTRPAKPGAAASSLSSDMVAAVRAASSGPVDLRFDLKGRPEVGQPVQVELAFIPNTRLERVTANFRAGEGLQLRDGAEMPSLERPPPGTPVSHTVTLVPQRDGVFHLNVVVLADSPQESLAQTFSIPLIAGAGVSEPTAEAAGSSGPP